MTTGNNRPALSRIKQAEQKTVDLEELVRQTLAHELDWLIRATDVLLNSAGNPDGKA